MEDVGGFLSFPCKYAGSGCARTLVYDCKVVLCCLLSFFLFFIFLLMLRMPMNAPVIFVRIRVPLRVIVFGKENWSRSWAICVR